MSHVMSTPEEWDSMIEDCLKRNSQLEPKEHKFLSDIERLRKAGFPLSPRQDGWLSDIWKRVTDAKPRIDPDDEPEEQEKLPWM